MIKQSAAENRSAVISWSALKRSCREFLRKDAPGLVFIYLHGSYQTILARILSREDHYLKNELLQSQFDTLEEPQNAIRIDIDEYVGTINDLLLSALP